MIVAADNRATVIDSLINWREKYLSQRQFVLLLSFFVGIFTSILAYLLKQFISWIASLLTAGFDATGSNWLFPRISGSRYFPYGFVHKVCGQ